MKFVAVCLMPLLLLAVGCAHQEAFEDTKRELQSQDEVIRALRKRNEELLARENSLLTELKATRLEVAALRQGKDVLDKDFASMKEKLAAFEQRFGELKEMGVRMKAHAEGVAFEVADVILFAPGKAALSSKGKALLEKLAERLKEHDGQIRVEGHTDDRPVVIHAKEYPMGNLQLSGRRALVVADYLIRQCGLPREMVSFAGYGEFKPVVSNASAEGRARNRRVEIVLLSASKAR